MARQPTLVKNSVNTSNVNGDNHNDGNAGYAGYGDTAAAALTMQPGLSQLTSRSKALSLHSSLSTFALEGECC